jgi:uncharacterized protein (TIGR02145 family)
LGWGAIPYVNDNPAGSYVREDGNAYLTTLTNDPVKGPIAIADSKGDICVYLTKIGAAPKGKRWRMPTSLEFKAITDYDKIGNFAEIASNTLGTTEITSGWKRKDLNHPYFPASGYRNVAAGALYNVGVSGGYWSSSPAGGNLGFTLGIGDTEALTTSSNYRTFGFSVRCVVQ